MAGVGVKGRCRRPRAPLPRPPRDPERRLPQESRPSRLPGVSRPKVPQRRRLLVPVRPHPLGLLPMGRHFNAGIIRTGV